MYTHALITVRYSIKMYKYISTNTNHEKIIIEKRGENSLEHETERI